MSPGIVCEDLLFRTTTNVKCDLVAAEISKEAVIGYKPAMKEVGLAETVAEADAMIALAEDAEVEADTAPYMKIIGETLGLGIY